MSAGPTELGRFLRARRDRITPAQAGIAAFPGPRRVPGLRREELALLTGISTDYLGRLEQGRRVQVSDAVLEALGRALRLDDAERAHLRDLALPAPPPRGGPAPAQRADPGLLRLAVALDHLPVAVLGHRSEVLARNALFESVLTRRFAPGEPFVRFLFVDPLARCRITNWDTFAAAAVASLRRESGRRPFDTALRGLIAQLRAADAAFDGWWDDHRVVDHASLTKRIDHPVAGPLRFDVESVSPPQDPDQRLVVYTAESDSATARALPLLASYGPDAGDTPAGAPRPPTGHGP